MSRIWHNSSLIICTKNRPEFLNQCLLSLIRQTTFPEEIVVIDNNSTDNKSKKVVQNFAKAHKKKVSIRYVFENKDGRPFARNRGIREARGRYIIFIDDDCIPSTHWLDGFKTAFKMKKIKKGVLAGRNINGYPNNIYAQIFQFFTTRALFFLLAGLSKKDRERSDILSINFLDTRNLALTRYVFGEIGVFDNLFIFGGEDGEFAYRAIKNNIPFFYIKKALVKHMQRYSFKDFVKIFYMKGRNKAMFLNKHGLKKRQEKEKIVRIFNQNTYNKLAKNQKKQIKKSENKALLKICKNKSEWYKICFQLVRLIGGLAFKFGYLYQRLYPA